MIFHDSPFSHILGADTTFWLIQSKMHTN